MIVDTHNDLLTEIAHFDHEEAPFARRWQDQLAAGDVGLQVCPVFVDRGRIPDGALAQALRQVSACHRAVAESGSILITTREDLRERERSQRLGLMLSMEGVEPLGTDPALLDVFHRLGVRMVGLTWNDRNAFADGAGESGPGGLSRLGRELLARMCDLGIIVDLAHASEATFWDILELVGDAPLVVSHASCRTVFDSPRNLSDEQLKALAERNAVVGIMAHPLVVDPAAPTLDRFIDHIEHALSMMGPRHVGLGSDFIRQVALSGAITESGNALLPGDMVLEDSIEGFEGPADYPRLTAALTSRGISGETLQDISSTNFLRVFETALP